MYMRLFGYEKHEVDEREEHHAAQLRQQVSDSKLQNAEAVQCQLEAFIRGVVRDEVERTHTRFFSKLKCGMRSSLPQIDEAISSQCQLQFRSKLPHTLFTGSRIETEQNSPVQVAIVDSLTNEIVTSGPLASLKVDVVAIDGDFCHDERSDWTAQEFSSYLLRQRDGKPQLLTGDLVVTLHNGVGFLGDIYFTDNSSWIRSRKFRLGLRAQKYNSLGYRVREGLSDTFLVKDHRGESYRKHHPPMPDDEVWRLEKIGKDGAFHRRLADKHICTVHDFLKVLVVNQDMLRNILGSGMSNKIWEATVQHAWECEIEKQLSYIYHVADKNVTLYFDSIFRVVKLEWEGCHYWPCSESPTYVKDLVDKLKGLAYQKLASIFEAGNPMPSSSGTLQNLEAVCSMPNNSNFVDPITHEDKANTQVGIKDWSSWNMELHGGSYQQKQNIDTLQFNTVPQDLTPRNQFGILGPQYNGMLPYTSDWDGPVQPIMNDDPKAWMHCFSSTDNLGFSDDGLLHAPGSDHYSSLSLPLPADDAQVTPRRSKWIKLLTTLKCGMSIRKRVAAKRRARLSRVGYQVQSHLPNIFGSF